MSSGLEILCPQKHWENMETQEQRDERMALELFPDIPASEPAKTTMTIEEAVGGKFQKQRGFR